LRNWETGRHGIESRFYPKIIEFLGYCPLPEAHSRGDAIRRERVIRGWSRKRLAEVAGVDEATVKRLESDTARMARQSAERVLKVLNVAN
jgi:DNA-binding transcriptional regulator YiaG